MNQAWLNPEIYKCSNRHLKISKNILTGQNKMNVTQKEITNKSSNSYNQL